METKTEITLTIKSCEDLRKVEVILTKNTVKTVKTTSVKGLVKEPQIEVKDSEPISEERTELVHSGIDNNLMEFVNEFQS